MSDGPREVDVAIGRLAVTRWHSGCQGVLHYRS
jgi:hypothetical protein